MAKLKVKIGRTSQKRVNKRKKEDNNKEEEMNRKFLRIQSIKWRKNGHLEQEDKGGNIFLMLNDRLKFAQ